MFSSRRVAIALMLAAAAIYAGFTIWAATRKLLPLDTPVSLSRGHVTTEPFKVNLASTYQMQLQIDPSRLFNLNCQAVDQCHKSLAMLRGQWVLSSAGKIVASGDIQTQYGDMAVLLWPLGFFDSSNGEYRIDLDLLSDAGALNPASPRLIVEISEDGYGRFAEWSEIISWLSGIVGIAGVGLLGASHFSRGASPESALGLSSTLGTAFRRTHSIRRLPQQVRVSRLPSFGLYSTLLLMLTVFSINVLLGLQLNLFPKKGMFVLTSSRRIGAARLKPLVLRIDRERKWFFNGKSIAPKDFPDGLKEALGRRSDWAVCLDADPELDFRTPAEAIDMIQGLHSKIVLVTPEMRRDRCVGNGE